MVVVALHLSGSAFPPCDFLTSDELPAVRLGQLEEWANKAAGVFQAALVALDCGKFKGRTCMGRSLDDGPFYKGAAFFLILGSGKETHM